MIVERGEGKANAAQASRPNDARHFPQIRKHSTPTQHGTAKRFADKCCTAMSAHRMPLRHSGRPVQHLHRPLSFAQDLATREGQRPRCPYGDESGSGDAAPPRGLCASRFADSEVGRVGRVRRVRRWFPEICFRSFALEFSQPSAKSFAQNLATPSARSFAHRIPHEMIEASFMREALSHLPLENQMSHASYASHTSHPKETCKARSTPPTNNTKQPTKGNKQMKLKVNWKELARQLWAAVRPGLLGAIGGGIVSFASGCSSLMPSDKTQTMGV